MPPSWRTSTRTRPARRRRMDQSRAMANTHAPRGGTQLPRMARVPMRRLPSTRNRFPVKVAKSLLTGGIFSTGRPAVQKRLHRPCYNPPREREDPLRPTVPASGIAARQPCPGSALRSGLRRAHGGRSGRAGAAFPPAASAAAGRRVLPLGDGRPARHARRPLPDRGPRHPALQRDRGCRDRRPAAGRPGFGGRRAARARARGSLAPGRGRHGLRPGARRLLVADPLVSRPSVAQRTGEIALLTGRAFKALVTPPYEIGLWVRQMEQIGVRSLGVAAITTIFTGMVLALQTALSLPSLGIKYYIGPVVSKSLGRELGPVLTALIVGGRIGSGMTAEIGTMKVTEQIDALRSMAADPVKKLVVPKLIASLIMLPALTILGDALGILGGLLVASTTLGLPPGLYLNDVFESLTLGDVGSGVCKSFFFAYFIAIVGCYNGLTTQGGADGVGRATTNTVVLAAILVLISDFFLTKIFYILT